MSWHTDRIELCTVGIVPVEIHRTACGIHRIGKLPVSVQRLYQGASALCRFFRILIDRMITVGWQLTDRNTFGSSSHLISASILVLLIYPFSIIIIVNFLPCNKYLSLRKNRFHDTLPGNQDFCGSICENMLIYKSICLISTNDRRFCLCYPQLKQSTVLLTILSGVSPP